MCNHRLQQHNNKNYPAPTNNFNGHNELMLGTGLLGAAELLSLQNTASQQEWRPFYVGAISKMIRHYLH